MGLINTDFVAWWGAILATFAIFWDVIKWRRTAPRLRHIIRPNTLYPDSKEISKKDTKEGISEVTVKPSIHIELANIGMVPTTIISIIAKRPLEQGGCAECSGSAYFLEHFGKKLPYMIGVGDMWSCRLDQNSVANLPSKDPVEIHISVSHLKKPLVFKVFQHELIFN